MDPNNNQKEKNYKNNNDQYIERRNFNNDYDEERYQTDAGVSYYRLVNKEEKGEKDE